MIRSMTGFGRYFLEEDSCTQVWEVRSVNGRHLDVKWRLPQEIRPFEAGFEKLVKSYASRGRVDISLNLSMPASALAMPEFNESLANMMLDRLEAFASDRGSDFEPDLSRLLYLSSLWESPSDEVDEGIAAVLEKGLVLALEDWNEARHDEGRALAEDLQRRFLLMDGWIERIRERAPDIKEERFANVQDRLTELLERVDQDLDENRFLQEISYMADRLDVSEELTRLAAHMDRLRELVDLGADAGRKLDFTLQECFREVTTCGNKIQDLHISRLIVDLKNELEKCREQVQNLE